MPKILTEKEVADLLEGLAGGPVVYFAENFTKYTTEECLQAYYDSLENQLAEKNAMIDWLVKQLDRLGMRCRFCCPINKGYEAMLGCVVENKSCDICWKEAAQEAVKKDG